MTNHILPRARVTLRSWCGRVHTQSGVLGRSARELLRENMNLGMFHPLSCNEVIYIGVKFTDGAYRFVVCEYVARGNVDGQYTRNVFRPIN